MGKLERREKLALDEAYKEFRAITKDEGSADLFQLVKCLKTVGNALSSARGGQLKLTIRLWQRIQIALFDKLLTSFPAHVVIYSSDGSALKPKRAIPEGAIVEIHPEGLRRADDFFKMEIEQLDPITRHVLNKIWEERGNSTRREDFANFDCGEYCTRKYFVVGDEVLRSESQKGKEQAYSEWWDLYWQAYCTPDKQQKKHIAKRMESIESVWGNQYY
jgi:hypothetical protein